jgi:hypothetical protein
MCDYISLKDLVNRDVESKLKSGKYQIQSAENCNYARINSFDKEIPDFCIMENDIDDFKCALIQYTLSDNDIKNNNFIMIGYLIKNKKNNDDVIGTLNLVFDPDDIDDFKIKKNVKGKFNIILSNNKNEKKIIKTMEYYVGNMNIVHMITEILGDCLVDIIKSN